MKKALRSHRPSDLREALSLSEAALESTTDGILVIDREGHIRTLNRRFVQMWRIPKSIVRSGNDARALAFVLRQIKDPERFLSRVRELYAEPRAESFDVIEFKDGRVFERYSRPQRIGKRIVGRVWSFRDATERRRLERQLAEAAGREQTRLGRELHDSIGQTITALMLLAKSAVAKLPKCSQAAVELHRIEELSRFAIQQTRNLARSLLPPELQTGDFEAALRALADGARDLFGVRCSVSVRGRTRLRDQAAAVELYRIAQEAVFNAAKHSASKSGIKVSFEGGAKRLRLKVSDDGIGLPHKGASGPGLGLSIMAHRAKLLGGKLEALRRGPNGGTVVVLECPAPR